MATIARLAAAIVRGDPDAVRAAIDARAAALGVLGCGTASPDEELAVGLAGIEPATSALSVLLRPYC